MSERLFHVPRLTPGEAIKALDDLQTSVMAALTALDRKSWKENEKATAKVMHLCSLAALDMARDAIRTLAKTGTV